MLSREEALRCTPIIHSSVHTHETEDGMIMLEYPLHVKPFLLSLFKRFRQNDEIPTKKLELDEMGSFVWRKIRSNSNTITIIESFAKSYDITLQEAEKSVTTFLAELGKRGLIAMS